MPGIFHGTTDILPGKLKRGAGDIQSVYRGSTKIWPGIPIWSYNGGGAAGAAGTVNVNQNFGTAAANRVVVVVLSVHNGDPAFLQGPVSIGGIPATTIMLTSPGSRIAIGIFAAAVPNGTQGIVSFKTANSSDYYTVDTYSVYGVPVIPQYFVNDTVLPMSQPTVAASFCLAAAQNWMQASGTLGSWAPPFIQRSRWSPQGTCTTATYDGGAVVTCSIPMTQPQSWSMNMMLACWRLQ